MQYTKEYSVAARAVVAALLGCAAAYVALLLLKNHLPAFQWNFDDGFDLSAAQKNCDVCKKAFYGAFFLSAPIAAAAALYVTRQSSGSLTLSTITAALVYLALYAANDYGSFRYALILLTMAAVTVGINRGANNYFPPVKASTNFPFTVRMVDLLAVAFLVLLLIPSDLERVTSVVRDESHKVSYFIGPALYNYAHGLVPGLDYHSHYGPALGWFFHLIMGSGWKSAAMRAVGLNIAITLATYIQAYFLLTYLIRSRLAAIGVVTALAVLAFSTANHFYSPSAYPTRFPLLIVFALAIGLHCSAPRRPAWLIVSAIMCAVSLLWQTEIGLFFLLTGAFVAAVAGGFPDYRNALLFIVTSIATALLLCLLLFGSRVLSLTFLIECFRPLVLYGTGWGSTPIKWALSWSILYNLPLQIVGCITIGWASIRLSRASDSKRDLFVTGVLLTLSMIGIALMIKWVNRTLDAVWHQNALPLVIVAAWWIRQFSAAWQPRFRNAAGASVAVATVLALLFVQDRNNPHLYGLRSYANYPSLLTWPFVSPSPGTWQEDFGRITETETKFIQDNTKPDERVLVIAMMDWAYLAQAHRAPEAYFMPLLVSFDAQFMNRSMSAANKLFYDNIVERRPESPRVREAMERIKQDFMPVETKGNLTLYERRH
ncbi:hypothetical protein [Bradyrhizobium stylosanthis]|uniref:4-amino-4-deoxy-L-arabinose transferase-like glycosyltransferase n=1 Tax=Bradyrhizobium stylosanthis TaxID=1803665 RepID=A0A560DWH6_9BRAD|nr:hypothetical protein [Bradyrhizobium stylosanthis]TWB01413.1 hypothetical protein FBZ96_103184 [Bradyrhizobium stylosanthis]